MSQRDSFRAAAVQAAPVWLDGAATVDKCVALIEEAADNGAALIAFPETFVPGYPWWLWLDSPAWGMQFVARYFDNSLALDGPLFARLREAARRSAITVVTGHSERDGGSLYMGQAIIGADGEVLAARRKLKPTHVERTVFGESDGSNLTVVDTELGRLGALCCWEHLQPLTKYAMYSQHEQIHVAAWPSFAVYRGAAYALGPEVNTGAARQYAVEGQCFVLSPCAVIDEAGVELFCDTPAKRELLLPGGGFAQIYGPDGRELGTALPETEEGLVYADLEASAVAVAKSAADPVGHYSRPDVLQLLWDPRPRSVVRQVALSAASPAESADDAEPAVR
ncbi:carbon-nitrogen hydrolase family protein [Nocardia farcinica]|uniref:carbon-nitrogen hydrolase family protein n=1 Tax=Nocardia farcinica TaxID=37329 RepID=UPI0018937B82|nr:carbon-nitrogen hydrolase family protein [Nocardia farcinica]MBF6248983.1 carbon-nitrogen hydrolase family protein [Nocardia farcinica]